MSGPREMIRDMTQRDVNAEFDTERQGTFAQIQAIRDQYQQDVRDFESGAAQAKLDREIAKRVGAGEIMMVGTNQYRSMQGWDRGEIWNVRQATRPGELTLLEPQSGLDLDAQGNALGMFDQPEWHNQGIVKLGGTESVDEALRLGGLDFEVGTKPVLFRPNGELVEVPGKFVTYNTATGEPFGTVGNIYRVIQNRQAFEFLQAIVESEFAKFSTAFPLNGGRRCVVSMKVPDDIVIDAEGVADHIQLYLAFFNNHDGQGKAECKVTPWRPRCRNTERLALQHAVSGWGTRHTTNAMNRLEEARREMGLVTSYAQELAKEETELLRQKFEMDQFNALMAELFPVGEEPTKRQADRHARRTEQLEELWAVESKAVGKNAYAAERAVTGWVDWQSPRQVSGVDQLAPRRVQAALVGADDDTKAKAHKQLLVIARG